MFAGKKANEMLDNTGFTLYNTKCSKFLRFLRRIRREGNKLSEIHVKENETLDNALKRFKRSCQKDGVLNDLRKKEYYQSPSVKRRKKSEAARKNKKRYY